MYQTVFCLFRITVHEMFNPVESAAVLIILLVMVVLSLKTFEADQLPLSVGLLVSRFAFV